MVCDSAKPQLKIESHLSSLAPGFWGFRWDFRTGLFRIFTLFQLFKWLDSHYFRCVSVTSLVFIILGGTSHCWAFIASWCTKCHIDHRHRRLCHRFADGIQVQWPTWTGSVHKWCTHSITTNRPKVAMFQVWNSQHWHWCNNVDSHRFAGHVTCSSKFGGSPTPNELGGHKVRPWWFDLKKSDKNGNQKLHLCFHISK